MIGKINPRGQSFKGVTAYLLHDKGAETGERVAWTSTHNLPTPDVLLASKVMAWTDQNREFIRDQVGGSRAGAKAEAGNVYHFSLSWEPGEEIDRESMENAALESVERLGLKGHQFYLVSHDDTDHPHVHVVANLVNPDTGKIWQPKYDRVKLDRWAYDYEKQYGIKCKKRAEKWERLDRDPTAEPFPHRKSQNRREEYTQLATEAFHASDNGKAFRSALQGHGLELARGNRRSVVVVDQDGQVYALNKLVELSDGSTGRARTKQISDRIKDLDKDKLEVADELAQKVQSYDRDGNEVKRQGALADGAERAAAQKIAAETKAEALAKEEAKMQRAKDLRVRQRSWQAHQIRIKRKTKASRQKWGIDALASKLQEAKLAASKLTGFWAKVFKRKQVMAASDRVQNLEKQLEERIGRFRDDLDHFNAKRPVWLIRHELAREGLAAPTTTRERIAAKGAALTRAADQDLPSPSRPSPALNKSANKEWEAKLSAEDREILRAAQAVAAKRKAAQARERDQGRDFGR